MSPFAGYDLRFFISRKLFAATSFEDHLFFKGHHIENIRRYDKTKVISSKGGHMNFLVLCTKMYGKLY